MAEKEKADQQEFQVKDRRRFTEDGERRRDESHAASDVRTRNGSAASSGKQQSERSEQIDPEARKAGETRTAPPRDLPEVNFSTFIFSLSSSTLIHLGLVPDPTSGKQAVDLPLAKQTIDILSMLKEKTRGNLTQEESKLMDNLIYDLKMRYVEAVKHRPSS